MTGEYRWGQLVSSRAGRDYGQYYLLLGRVDERFVLVADGHKRTAAAPKKKNLRHLVLHHQVAWEIEQKLAAGETPGDVEVRAALAELLPDAEASLDQEGG